MTEMDKNNRSALLSLGLDAEVASDSSLSWNCPACRAEIQHAEFERSPTSGGIYRCPDCRIDWLAKETAGRLSFVPLLRTFREMASRTDDRLAKYVRPYTRKPFA
jgi:predicted RNA-binding Zn-ribbon protein involved in translation (DUF1610 family)